MDIHKDHLRPLNTRPYRFKTSVMNFFCPLCRTERAMTLSYRLSRKNYLQMGLTTLVLVLSLYPVMGVRSFFSFFFVWAGFEIVLRFLYRKEVPCPYCGFDASWYKKDVKVARRLVQEFWAQKQGQQEGPSETVGGEYFEPAQG